MSEEKLFSKALVSHSRMLVGSLQKWTGKTLFDLSLSDESIFSALYNSDFVVVSHGAEADPVFNFANKKAQELWKLSWEEFTRLPSRLSAEPLERSERESLLKKANENGFIDNYTGVRISSKGERFLIKNTILWNVVDDQGVYQGQAAMFSDWEYL